MDACGGCGAPGDPGSLVCAFCGRVTQELASAADELKALEELSRVSQKMAQQGSFGGVLGALSNNIAENLGRGRSSQIAQFWQNAFIPRTLEGQSQAMLQMFGQAVVPDGFFGSMQFAMNNAEQKNIAIYLDRAEAILTAMRVQHAGSSTAAAKTAVLESELEKERGRVRSARFRGWAVYAALMLGGFGCLGGMALLTALL